MVSIKSMATTEEYSGKSSSSFEIHRQLWGERREFLGYVVMLLKSISETFHCPS